MESTQFIDDTPERPNVAQFVVFLIMNLFGAHVIWSTDMRECKLRLVVHHSGQTKVAEFAVRIAIQKYVSRLQVSMQYFLRQLAIIALINRPLRIFRVFVCSIIYFCCFCSSMTMVQGRYSLSEYFPNEIFTYMILTLPAPPYELLQVATITIFHDNEDFSCSFVDQTVIIFHYVSMVKLPQNINFRNNLLLLLLRHDAVVELFPNKNSAIRNTFDLLYFSK